MRSDRERTPRIAYDKKERAGEPTMRPTATPSIGEASGTHPQHIAVQITARSIGSAKLAASIMPAGMPHSLASVGKSPAQSLPLVPARTFS